jgi:DNA repair exonuclease SbcCD ATPase subunit
VLPGPAFEIATATLPDAIAKSPYAAQLSADAPGAVDWQISNLPPGLSSKGDTISGTPASSGVSAINIQIKAGNLTASKTLPLTVGAADYGSASVDWSIVSAIAGIVGGIIVPAILFSIAQHMEKKSQGDSDKNLREVIDKVDNAAKRISDAINDSQSAAATDRAALTADTGTLAEDLKKRHEALSKTTDALEARQKKLEDEAKRLGEELRDQEKESQKLRDEIAQAEDQAKKETLEKEEAAASEAIRKVAEAHEAVERAAEANGERKDDAEHRERSDGRAAEIAK